MKSAKKYYMQGGFRRREGSKPYEAVKPSSLNFQQQHPLLTISSLGLFNRVDYRLKDWKMWVLSLGLGCQLSFTTHLKAICKRRQSISSSSRRNQLIWLFAQHRVRKYFGSAIPWVRAGGKTNKQKIYKQMKHTLKQLRQLSWLYTKLRMLNLYKKHAPHKLLTTEDWSRDRGEDKLGNSKRNFLFM